MLVNPLMLAWLGGASAPLIVHLLSRSRYRSVDWGAMMFLSGPGDSIRHDARLRQWTLLGLRMAMVGLLAVALARPVISAGHTNIPTAGLVTASTAAAVIVLDDSPAMGYVAGDKSRMDLARQVTLQLLSTFKRGDEAALLLAGNREFPVPTALSPDIQSIASKVSDLQPDVNQPDMAIDLDRAVELLDHAGPVEREIFIVTDRQAMPWRNVLADPFNQKWLAHRSTGPLPRVTIFSVGGDESDNIAVDAIEIPDRPVMQGRPTTLQIRVRNYGPVAATDIPLTVWSGTRETRNATLTVPAHSARNATLPWRFDESGSHIISAAVRSTGLTTDDRLDVAVDVLKQVRVLIVDNPAVIAATKSTTAPTTRPASVLSSALLAANRPAEPLFALTEVAPAGLNIQSLKKTDVLILNDVNRLGPNQLNALQKFLENGGGVLLLPGNETRAAVLNAALHGNGINILPATLKPASSKPVHVASFVQPHPLFHFLASKADPFASVTVSRFFPSTVNTTEARVVAKFASGDPFILESSINKGRVIFLATSLDPAWSSLSKAPVLQPLLVSMVHFLGAGAAVDRNAGPAAAVQLTADDPVQGASANLQSLSSAMHETVPVVHEGEHYNVHFNRPGAYRARFITGGVDQSVDFVVNPGHASADLTPLNALQWKTLMNRANFEQVDLSKTSAITAVESQRGGREIWIDLLGGVLVLLVAEMLLSRWWTEQPERVGKSPKSE